MKKTTMITSAALAISCALPVFAEGDKPKRGPKSGGRAEILKKFDADGNGKLDEKERAAAKAAMKKRQEAIKAKMLARFDADKDGKLSEDERKTARETIAKERQEIRTAVLAQFDANGNGELDENEREGVREWVKENYPDALPPQRGRKPQDKDRKGKGKKRKKPGADQ